MPWHSFEQQIFLRLKPKYCNQYYKDLSANSITELSDFENLLSLRVLNLSSNLIEAIPSGSDHLKYLISLEDLNLSYNLIKNVAGLSQLGSKNHKIRRLQLHGNDIKHPNDLANALRYSKNCHTKI